MLSTFPIRSAVTDFQLIEIVGPVRTAIEATAFPTADRRLVVLLLHDRKHTVVWGDSVRLEQVFISLIENAIKFTPEGGAIVINVAVSISAVEVTVTDTGVGIARDMLDRIFKPCSQTGESRDPKRIGLGLALVRDIVRTHGGSLTAWSCGIGSGSSFSVRLPLALASRPPHPA